MIPLRDINPTKRFAIVTFLLIALNATVFLFELTLREYQVRMVLAAFALVPQRLFSPEIALGSVVPASVTLISSLFLHGGFLHIAGNMLYLWIFGNNVEDATGRVRFIIFYLLCGISASFAHALMNPASLTPLIGASGAVAGVLGAYLLLYPRARVVTLIFFGFFIRTIEVPAMIVLGFWFVLQFLNALVSGSAGGGVAWFAHLGGFLTGMLLIRLFQRGDAMINGRRG